MVMPPNIKKTAQQETTKVIDGKPHKRVGEVWVTTQEDKPNWVEAKTFKDQNGIQRIYDYPNARGMKNEGGVIYVDLPEDYDHSKVVKPIAPNVNTGSVESDTQANKLLMLERQLAEQTALIEQLTSQSKKTEAKEKK